MTVPGGQFGLLQSLNSVYIVVMFGIHISLYFIAEASPSLQVSCFLGCLPIIDWSLDCRRHPGFIFVMNECSAQRPGSAFQS